MDIIRTAIVTGGSKGLGRELAAQLVSDGWTVVVDGRDEESLATAARVTGAVAVPGDVGDAGHRGDLLATALRHGGRLDLVVNNASSLGTTPLPRLADQPLDDLRRLYETNVVAPLALVQATLHELRRTGGSVLNVTSDAAVEAYPSWGGYGSSKAALEQLSRVLAEEEPSLRVWWVDPGDMRTEMQQAAFPDDDLSDRADPAEVARTLAEVVRRRPPSGRLRALDLQAAVAP